MEEKELCDKLLYIRSLMQSDRWGPAERYLEKLINDRWGPDALKEEE
jgi:hypothetical protein